MEPYEIIITPDAEADLFELRNYIADDLLVPDTAPFPTSKQSERKLLRFRKHREESNRLTRNPGIHADSVRSSQKTSMYTFVSMIRQSACIS